MPITFVPSVLSDKMPITSAVCECFVYGTCNLHRSDTGSA